MVRKGFNNDYVTIFYEHGHLENAVFSPALIKLRKKPQIWCREWMLPFEKTLN